jgi:hypothetical protein
MKAARPVKEGSTIVGHHAPRTDHIFVCMDDHQFCMISMEITRLAWGRRSLEKNREFPCVLCHVWLSVFRRIMKSGEALALFVVCCFVLELLLVPHLLFCSGSLCFFARCICFFGWPFPF